MKAQGSGAVVMSINAAVKLSKSNGKLVVGIF